MVANHASPSANAKCRLASAAAPDLMRSLAPLDPESAEAHHLLESLDDAMFAAIAGDAGALAPARELWHVAFHSLSAEQIEESREQYLRYALEMARRFEAEDEVRDPAHAMMAIEILERLLQ
jgi:hypothetical protein